MKRPLVVLFITALAVSILEPLRASDYGETTKTHSKEFQRMSGLAGTWEGPDAHSSEGGKLSVEYQMTAGGTAILERLFPGTAHEMVSVYYDQNGKLMMTHYCMLGNQPRMAVSKSTPQKIEFEFSPKDNVLNAKKEPHMHAMRLAFLDDHTINEDWVLYQEGKEKAVESFQLKRAP